MSINKFVLFFCLSFQTNCRQKSRSSPMVYIALFLYYIHNVYDALLGVLRQYCSQKLKELSRVVV